MIHIKLGLALAFYFAASTTSAIQNRVVRPPLKDVYEFWLTVDYRLTMGIWENDRHMSYLYPDYIGDQKYYYRQSFPKPGCNNYLEYKGNLSTLIIGDGRHRDVFAINDSVPGPPIVVYQGSTVIVHVTNRLEDPITIHWHGLDQRGSFFMDGVPALSQCPILPRQTFTYKFQVLDSPGTYWYHGHNALELGNGVFGPFIVLDVSNKDINTQDFIAVVNDWFPHAAQYYYLRTKYDKMMFLYEYDDRDQCAIPTLNLAGDAVSVVPWSSAIINGRGWHNISELRAYADRLPVEEFRAESDSSKPIKLRLINAGINFGLLFSVDEHKLTVVASDARNIRPVTNVDYVHVSPGERYDVILTPLTETTDRSFPVRIRNLEYLDLFFNEQPEDRDRFGFAWLIYDNGQKTKYREDNRQCTRSKPCVEVNCALEKYPDAYNRICINLENLREDAMDRDEDNILRPSSHLFQQYFINFGIPTGDETTNRIQFIPPTSPPFMHPGKEMETITKCDDACGRTRPCDCSHHQDLQLGNTIELVIVNQAYGPEANKYGIGHPIHVHGHHFYVVRQGWPTNTDKNLPLRVNDDIVCDSNALQCHFNDNNGTTTGLSKKDKDGNLVPWQYTFEDGYKPVFKDTVYIPHGGYLVVRFKADNPGWWLAHCHILTHHAHGMVMFFHEGKPSQMPMPSDDFPTCGVRFGRVRS